METLSLAERDRQTIWHPFTQMQNAPLPIPIIGGKGTYLIGENEDYYLDAFSSWWVNLHGHAHPYLAECLFEQAQKIEHVAFTDFTHQPAIELAEKLLNLLPSHFSKVFYSDNGSTAIETALKLVIQFWVNQDPCTQKINFVCFKNAYHGDTFGAMSVAGKGMFNQPFWPFLFNVLTIDPPYLGKEEVSLQQLEEITLHYPVAGFIFEPLIQGAGGMKVHSLEGLDQLIGYCRKQGVMTIADEVMTGFGRTPSLFVIQKLKNSPDIICLAKGITGGMLPLSATICTQSIYNAFLSSDSRKAFLHGHSYYGNPLACAVALGSLNLLLDSKCFEQRKVIEQQHQLFCQKWQFHPVVSRIECIGTILIIEYVISEKNYYDHPIGRQLKQFFFQNKIIVRPLGNILYVMPPYCITLEDLKTIYSLIIETLERYHDLFNF